ncbi:MAG: hypothetical protein WA066_03050 [Candidatus Omnitrophota bacterium]
MLNIEDQKAIVELRQHYKNVFSSSSGKIVFHDMLKRSFFFNDDLTPDLTDALGRRNFMAETLEILGVADNPYMTSSAIAEALLNLPILSQPLKEEG